jgi:hypothetical protein
MSESTKKMIRELLSSDKCFTDAEIAKIIIEKTPGLSEGKTIDSFRRRIAELRSELGIPSAFERRSKVIFDNSLDENESLKQKVKTIIKRPVHLYDICNTLDKSPKQIESILEELKTGDHLNISNVNQKIQIEKELKAGGVTKIDIDLLDHKTFRFGLTGDNHLCSKYERLDCLNALYDMYEREEIATVFNAGNFVDGVTNFNKNDVYSITLDGQTKYLFENYPKKEGIVTRFVCGDDHEGWWVQREGIDLPSYLNAIAKDFGREDLIFEGYIEYDYEFESELGKCLFKNMHPGGGSAYAESYTPQKIIESFQEGEKPNLLALGHYHKIHYSYYRGIHYFQTGCTQDQTPFMRKKRIKASLGGWLVSVTLDINGAVSWCDNRLLSFYNKDYYKPKYFKRW